MHLLHSNTEAPFIWQLFSALCWTHCLWSLWGRDTYISPEYQTHGGWPGNTCGRRDWAGTASAPPTTTLISSTIIPRARRATRSQQIVRRTSHESRGFLLRLTNNMLSCHGVKPDPVQANCWRLHFLGERKKCRSIHWGQNHYSGFRHKQTSILKEYTSLMIESRYSRRQPCEAELHKQALERGGGHGAGGWCVRWRERERESMGGEELQIFSSLRTAHRMPQRTLHCFGFCIY